MSNAWLAADAQPLPLQGPEESRAIEAHLGVLEDPDWSLDIADIAQRGVADFAPVPPGGPDFGYTDSRIWLALPVTATAEGPDWVLYIRENFLQHVRAHLVTSDGAIRTVMDLSRATPFAERPLPFPELATTFTLPQGETATIFIEYWSEGSSKLSLAIETPDSFAALSATKFAKDFTFYGMAALLIVAALVAFAFLRQAIFLAYAGYACSGLLYVMHADGTAFQYLWPGAPLFNSVATVFTGGGIIVFGAIFARLFLQTAQLHPRMDLALRATIYGTLGLIVVLFWIDLQALKQILVFVSLIAMLLFALSGLIAARTRFREVRFYVFAWSGAVLSASLLNMRHLLGIDIDQELLHDSIRGVLVLDAAMMGLAILDRFSQIARSREAVVQRNLAQTTVNLDLTRRLAELEARYNAATELAHSRDRELKDTIHDLRQPLLALRLKVGELTTGPGGDGAAIENLETTFGYLEGLVEEHMVTPEDGAFGSTRPRRDSAPGATLPLSEVVTSVAEMFDSDARSKGLAVRFRANDDRPVPALPLMRILSNLVSNALKYTEAGGILIAVRPSRQGVRIEVHDTGSGLTADEFERARGRSVRIERTADLAEGAGLGLAIADQIARQHGWSLSLSPVRKQGSGLVVTLPNSAD